MAKGVGAGPSSYLRCANGLGNRLLHVSLMQVMASLLASRNHRGQFRSRKQPLPGKLLGGIAIFFSKAFTRNTPASRSCGS